MEHGSGTTFGGRRLLLTGLGIALLVAGGYLLFQRLSGWPDPVNPVTPEGREVAVLDFSSPFPLDPPPEGWWHRRFWTRTPMEIDFVEADGVRGLRCRTDDSASIFGRFADIPLTEYPVVAWRWRVDDPVETDLDETTPQGDDHPARLFVRFETGGGEARSMEIIWSNGALRPGEYKYIDGFPHYVAQSGTGALGRWVREEVDLLAVYEEIWRAGESPRLTYLGVFCDTDETDGESEAVFSTVRMRRVAGSG